MTFPRVDILDFDYVHTILAQFEDGRKLTVTKNTLTSPQECDAKEMYQQLKN